MSVNEKKKSLVGWVAEVGNVSSKLVPTFTCLVSCTASHITWTLSLDLAVATSG